MDGLVAPLLHHGSNGHSNGMQLDSAYQLQARTLPLRACQSWALAAAGSALLCPRSREQELLLGAAATAPNRWAAMTKPLLACRPPVSQTRS